MTKRLCLCIGIVYLCIVTTAFAEPAMELHQAKAVVELLFKAAAGTSDEEEAAARERLSAEEFALRSEENALYRRQVRPWLLTALAAPADENADSDAIPAPIDENVDTDATPAPADEELDFEAIYALFAERPAGREYVEALRALGYEGAEACLSATRSAAGIWLGGIDEEALLEINADYAGWLTGPGTVIDYPLAHGSDNAYYLHRMFNGESNACGTLFLDYRNLPDFRDPNTLIFGHHMRDGSMFKSITFYAEQGYFDAHPYLYLSTPAANYLVEIFAAYTTDKGDHCYDIAISDEEDMREYVAAAVAKSDFRADVGVTSADRLATLSTCAYSFENARYVAIGKLTELTREAD